MNASQLKQNTFVQLIITKAFHHALVFHKVPQEDHAMLQLVISNASREPTLCWDAPVTQQLESEIIIYFYDFLFIQIFKTLKIKI